MHAEAGDNCQVLIRIYMWCYFLPVYNSDLPSKKKKSGDECTIHQSRISHISLLQSAVLSNHILVESRKIALWPFACTAESRQILNIALRLRVLQHLQLFIAISPFVIVSPYLDNRARAKHSKARREPTRPTKPLARLNACRGVAAHNPGFPGRLAPREGLLVLSSGGKVSWTGWAPGW